MPHSLITGGAHSGKSRRAEFLVRSLPGRPIYIATAEIGDAEMAARVAEHQARRGPEWDEHPAPLDLCPALQQTDGRGPRLVDCLTLWLSNLFAAERDWQAAAKDLVACLARQQSPVILVTNEVGLGLVPESRLGRNFRDAQGCLNQIVAGAVAHVELVVAGIPVRVKS